MNYLQINTENLKKKKPDRYQELLKMSYTDFCALNCGDRTLMRKIAEEMGLKLYGIDGRDGRTDWDPILSTLLYRWYDWPISRLKEEQRAVEEEVTKMLSSGIIYTDLTSRYFEDPGKAVINDWRTAENLLSILERENLHGVLVVYGAAHYFLQNRTERTLEGVWKRITAAEKSSFRFIMPFRILTAV